MRSPVMARFTTPRESMKKGTFLEVATDSEVPRSSTPGVSEDGFITDEELFWNPAYISEAPAHGAVEGKVLLTDDEQIYGCQASTDDASGGELSTDDDFDDDSWPRSVSCPAVPEPTRREAAAEAEDDFLTNEDVLWSHSGKISDSESSEELFPISAPVEKEVTYPGANGAVEGKVLLTDDKQIYGCQASTDDASGEELSTDDDFDDDSWPRSVSCPAVPEPTRREAAAEGEDDFLTDEDVLWSHSGKISDSESSEELFPISAPVEKAVTYTHIRAPQKAPAKDVSSEEGMQFDTTIKELPADCVTVMLRHVPVGYKQNTLFNELNAAGFEGSVDFFYLPINMRTKRNRGFAFANFVNADRAFEFFARFHGSRLRKHFQGKDLAVIPADLQGLEAISKKFEATMLERASFRPIFASRKQSIKTAKKQQEIKRVIEEGAEKDKRDATEDEKAVAPMASSVAESLQTASVCSNCCTTVVDGWVFCARCGVKLQ